MNGTTGHKAATGTIWAAIDRFGVMAVQFVANMVLAWLLSPADFAVIGILVVFIAVSNSLLDGGFGSALIQKDKPTERDYSTVFYFNAAVSVVVYGALYASAPAISAWFAIPVLGPVLRVLGLVLIANAFCIIPATRLRKQLAFKRLAVVSVASATAGGVIGISLALRGAGVWALVALQVVSASVRAILLWVVAQWSLRGGFSMRSLRSLFGFGGYMFASGILQEMCNNIQGAVIGRFAPLSVGYFNQARKLDQVASYTLPNVLVQVLFPVYSSLSGNSRRMAAVLAANVRLVSLLVMPLLCVLAIMAEPLIGLIYTDKWLPAVPYFRIFCVAGLTASLQNINFYAVAAAGHSRELFAWSLYKWPMLLIFIFIGKIWGVTGICWGMTAGAVNIYLVNAALASKYVGYSVGAQMADIRGPLLTSLSGLGMAMAVDMFFPVIPAGVTAMSFAFYYLLMAATFRFRGIADLRNWLKMLKNRQRRAEVS